MKSDGNLHTENNYKRGIGLHFFQKHAIAFQSLCQWLDFSLGISLHRMLNVQNQAHVIFI